jgi:hypothetical protein
MVPVIAWALQFLFGTGAYWEMKRSPLVSLQIGQGLAELYQKKAAALEDILRPEMVAAPSNSPVWKAKLDYLNTIEKTIAQMEGRRPVPYGRPAAPTVRVE